MIAEAVNKKELGVVKAQLTKAVKIANEIEITSQADYDKAAKKLIEVKKMKKDFLVGKKSWLDPINELRNKVFAISRPIEAKFAQAETVIDRAMTSWEQKIERERQEEARKLEEIAEKKRIAAEKKAAEGKITQEEAQAEAAEGLAEATDKAGKLETVQPVVTNKGTASTRQIHELVVVDKTLLPEEFKVPDMSAIKSFWRENGTIPAGCKIETRQVRTARTL